MLYDELKDDEDWGQVEREIYEPIITDYDGMLDNWFYLFDLLS